MVDNWEYSSTKKYDCDHENGWFVTVTVKFFGLFERSKRVYVCSDCGETLEQD